MKVRIRERQKTIALVGVTLLIACWAVLFITFLAAWLNGGTIIIDINSMGEAPIELIILIILPFFGLYSIKHIIDR